MKAVAYHGKRDVRVDTVPDPTIEMPADAIVRITSVRFGYAVHRGAFFERLNDRLAALRKRLHAAS